MSTRWLWPRKLLTENHGAPARTRARILRAQSGQSLIEFAVLLPFLLLLLIGGIEIGRYAYLGILVGNAAHAGAFYGSQTLSQSVDTAGIITAADNDFLNNGQLVNTLTVTSSVACGCDNLGTITPATCSGTTTAGTCTAGHWVVTVSVQASGTFKALFNYPGIPATIAVTRTSTMRVPNVG
jgi:Flp pilus assembly protein TadG